MAGLQIGASKRRSSRLADLLHARGVDVGFRQQSGSKKRTTGIIASMPAGDTDGFQAAIAAGADALEVRIAAGRDFKGLAEYVKRSAVPLGVDVTHSNDQEGLAEQARQVGIEWVRLTIDAAITTLAWDSPGRVVTIPSDFDLALARGIGGLILDAISITSVGLSVPFTLQEAVRMRALSEIVRLPIVLHAGDSLPASAAGVADQLGISALLLHVDGLRDIARLSDYIGTLERQGPDGP